MLGVRCLLDLVVSLVGETNAEHANFVSVSGRHIDGCFDESLPLLDHRAKLVSEISTVQQVVIQSQVGSS